MSVFDESKRNVAIRISLFEAALWILAMAVCFASPLWLGQSSLLLTFYGPAGALTWRLSTAIPVQYAFIIALTVATMLTAAMVPVAMETVQLW